MIVQIGVFIVCLALAVFLAAKAAREVYEVKRERRAENVQGSADNAEQQKKAKQNAREMENFMTYDGRVKEDAYAQD